MLLLTILLSGAVSLLAKVLADQFLTERISIIGSFAGLKPTFNPGIAFSVSIPWGLQTEMIFAALLLVLVVAWRTAQTTLSKIGYGMIVGGGLGNLIDRLRDGIVTDYFQVSSFPVFNVADSFITIGVVFLLWEAMKGRGTA